MARIRHASACAALLLGGLAAASAAPINLVANAGFEGGSTGGHDAQNDRPVGALNGFSFTPAASGSSAFDDSVAVAASLIPEPASLALLGAGLLGLGQLRRRKPT